MPERRFSIVCQVNLNALGSLGNRYGIDRNILRNQRILIRLIFPVRLVLDRYRQLRSVFKREPVDIAEAVVHLRKRRGHQRRQRERKQNRHELLHLSSLFPLWF